MRSAAVQLYVYHQYMDMTSMGLAVLSALGLRGMDAHIERFVLGLCVHRKEAACACACMLCAGCRSHGATAPGMHQEGCKSAA